MLIHTVLHDRILSVYFLHAVNDLYGRLFATWTFLTCCLCLACARDITNPSIYGKPIHAYSKAAAKCCPDLTSFTIAGVTLLSFVVALLHFLSELLIFKTMSIKGAASPMIVAGEMALRPVASALHSTRNFMLHRTMGCMSCGFVFLLYTGPYQLITICLDGS